MDEITTAFINEYHDAFMHVYQQTEAKVTPYMRHESQNSELKFWNYLGKTSAIKDLPRGADTPNIITPHTRRACKLHSYTWAELTDDRDVIQSLTSPHSDYLKAGVAALRRAEDEDALAAMKAAVLTGKEGTTSVNSYDAGESRLINGDGTIVTAGSAFSGSTETPLTVAKLQTISRLMSNASVPMEGRYLVSNFYNKEMLQAETEVKNVQYNDTKVLVNDVLTQFMGFTFIWLEDDRFTVNSTDTGCIECYAWQRDAMMETTGHDVKTNLTQESTKNYNTQVWAQSFKGYLRLQGPGVVQILLDKE